MATTIVQGIAYPIYVTGSGTNPITGIAYAPRGASHVEFRPDNRFINNQLTT